MKVTAGALQFLYDFFKVNLQFITCTWNFEGPYFSDKKLCLLGFSHSKLPMTSKLTSRCKFDGVPHRRFAEDDY